MLNIDPQTVCFIAGKAREFDAKVEVADPEARSNTLDEDIGDVLEDRPNDPTYEELKAAIDSLNEDQQIDLVALTWLGRGDFTSKEWEEGRGRARDSRSDHTSLYLLGIPLLGDYLQEGISALGYFCEDYEMRL